jgi:hypothetical protein
MTTLRLCAQALIDGLENVHDEDFIPRYYDTLKWVWDKLEPFRRQSGVEIDLDLDLHTTYAPIKLVNGAYAGSGFGGGGGYGTPTCSRCRSRTNTTKIVSGIYLCWPCLHNLHTEAAAIEEAQSKTPCCNCKRSRGQYMVCIHGHMYCDSCMHRLTGHLDNHQLAEAACTCCHGHVRIDITALDQYAHNHGGLARGSDVQAIRDMNDRMYADQDRARTQDEMYRRVEAYRQRSPPGLEFHLPRGSLFLGASFALVLCVVQLKSYIQQDVDVKDPSRFTWLLIRTCFVVWILYQTNPRSR